MACHALIGALRRAPPAASQHARSPPPQGFLQPVMLDDFSDGLLATVTKPLRSCHNGDGGYYVFNPSTGAALALPDSKIPLKSSFELPTKPYKPCPWPPEYMNVSYGLGNCSATGEHKVVRVYSDQTNGDAEQQLRVMQNCRYR
ncbi:hypothetical protein ABZP36_010739 [Zizania latifolia]